MARSDLLPRCGGKAAAEHRVVFRVYTPLPEQPPRGMRTILERNERS